MRRRGSSEQCGTRELVYVKQLAVPSEQDVNYVTVNGETHISYLENADHLGLDLHVSHCTTVFRSHT